MIKYNLNTINDWNFGTSNVIKVYRNNAIVFYKVSGESPTPEYKVCFAVVDDITQYQETEFEDVYDKTTEKWYKLNNLNEYEEYGVYGSGRTSCGGSTSRLPQGYTEVEYIENTSTAYINTDLQIYSSTTNSFEVESKLIAAKHDSQTYQNVFSCMSEDGEPYQGFTYRYQPSLAGASIPNGQNTFTIVNNEDLTQTVTVTSSSSQRTYTHTYPLTLFCGLNSSRNPFRWTNSKFYYCKIKMNDELVRDFVPCKRDSDDKYGMYDLVTNTFYLSPNNVNLTGGDPITPTDCVTTYNGKLTIDDGYEYEWNGSSWVNVGEVSGSSYPKYYSEKSEPLDSLTFNTLAEAQTYAYNNCVYNGMTATIGGVRYVFNSEEGWVEPPAAKWVATYTGGTTTSAECDSTSEITRNEITKANLESVVIGDCVSALVGECFSDCSKLSAATINGYTSIDHYCFARNNGTLKTITMLSPTPPPCATTAFTYYNNGYVPMTSIRIYVPAASVNAYKAASGWSRYADKIQAIP